MRTVPFASTSRTGGAGYPTTCGASPLTSHQESKRNLPKKTNEEEENPKATWERNRMHAKCARAGVCVQRKTRTGHQTILQALCIRRRSRKGIPDMRSRGARKNLHASHRPRHFTHTHDKRQPSMSTRAGGMYTPSCPIGITSKKKRFTMPTLPCYASS